MIRVILADDHKLVTEGLQRLLERAFEVCAVVSDGEALVEAAERLRPDVIVTEITLPRLNGLDAVRELCRRGNPARGVVLTMHADAFLAAEAFRAGVFGYVVKQSASDELLESIRLAAQNLLFIPPLLGRGVFSELSRTHQPTPALGALTRRQRQLLQLSAEGYSIKRIAQVMKRSPRTIEAQKYRLMRTLQVHNTVELIRCAARLGLIALPPGPVAEATYLASNGLDGAPDWMPRRRSNGAATSTSPCSSRSATMRAIRGYCSESA